jgi:hypothetical protein
LHELPNRRAISHQRQLSAQPEPEPGTVSQFGSRIRVYPLREAVTAMDDLTRLKQWHRLAIQLPSLAEFETRMHKR